MNLLLQLKAETEMKLRKRATLTGQSLETLALEALEEKLATGPEPGEVLPLSTRLAELRAWLASMPGGNPNADFSRESIYGKRGE
jgi:hypothetical protein